MAAVRIEIGGFIFVLREPTGPVVSHPSVDQQITVA